MISSYLNILSINLSRLSFQAPICTNFKVATYRKEGSAIFYLLEFMPELFFFLFLHRFQLCLIPLHMWF